VIKFGDEKLKSVFNFLEDIRVFTLDQLMSSLKCSMPTARLKLKRWQAYTSYNQNSRYYALPTVPHFDENGLWFYKNIFFSKYGNLRDTVVHLINNSPSGLTGNEIGDLVHLSPRSFLHHFREVVGIQRQKVEGVYAYYSDDPDRYKVQVQNRSRATFSGGERLNDADAVIILAALIKQHGLGVEDIMKLPEVRRRNLPRAVIDEFLDRHDLLKKTPDTGL
jgi:hypothetical protein